MPPATPRGPSSGPTATDIGTTQAPRTALVTGASRGIGAAIALRLGLAGIKVAVTARTMDPHPKTPGTLRDTVEAIENAGAKLYDLHVADNNRMACGQGALDWERLLQTCKKIGYDGSLTVEFVPVKHVTGDAA